MPTHALGPGCAPNRHPVPVPVCGLPTAGRILYLRADVGLFQDVDGLTPAAANADPVGRWNDAAGGALFGYQPGSSLKRPSLRTNQVNGWPAVRFDGVDDALQFASVPISTFTAFLVWKPTYPNPGDNNPRFPLEHSATPNSNPGHNLCISRDATALHTVARGAGGATKSAYACTAANALDFGNSWAVLAHDYDGTHPGHAAYRLSLATPLSTTTFMGFSANPGSSTVTDTLNLGSRNNTAYFAQMDVALLALYSPALSAAVRQRATKYLARLFGLALT